MPGRSSAVLIAVKAVPGASRDEIIGVLGDRLKVRVSAPPEGGRANRAIAGLLAGAVGVRVARVELVAGGASPAKIFRIAGLGMDDLPRAWTGGGCGCR